MTTAEIGNLHELAELVRSRECFVRYSGGPEHDAAEASRDLESGLDLPGLSVNPLVPEPWWTRPDEDWLARQLCQYRHLADEHPDRFPWILAGRVVGRGPDCEPLVADAERLARLSATALAEAESRYDRFERGRAP